MIKELPAIYRDTGCRLHPSCLNCPRPRCIYDEGEGAEDRALFFKERQAEIVRRFLEGEPVIHIAAQMWVATRTVHRALAEARRKYGNGLQARPQF